MTEERWDVYFDFRPFLHHVKCIPLVPTSMCLMIGLMIVSMHIVIILPIGSNLLLSYVGIVFIRNERCVDKLIINAHHRKPNLIKMGLNPTLSLNLGPPKKGEGRTLPQLVDNFCVSLSRFDTILCIIRFA